MLVHSRRDGAPPDFESVEQIVRMRSCRESTSDSSSLELLQVEIPNPISADTPRELLPPPVVPNSLWVHGGSDLRGF